MVKRSKIILLIATVVLGASLAAMAVDNGKVTITSPKQNQIFNTSSVTIEWFADLGKDGDHVHLYLDGKLIGREYLNSYTLKNLKPGTHTVELRLATKWYSEPGPKADVTFSVTGKGG